MEGDIEITNGGWSPSSKQKELAKQGLSIGFENQFLNGFHTFGEKVLGKYDCSQDYFITQDKETQVALTFWVIDGQTMNGGLVQFFWNYPYWANAGLQAFQILNTTQFPNLYNQAFVQFTDNKQEIQELKELEAARYSSNLSGTSFINYFKKAKELIPKADEFDKAYYDWNARKNLQENILLLFGK